MVRKFIQPAYLSNHLRNEKEACLGEMLAKRKSVREQNMQIQDIIRLIYQATIHAQTIYHPCNRKPCLFKTKGNKLTNGVRASSLLVGLLLSRVFSRFIVATVGQFSALFWQPQNRAVKPLMRYETKKKEGQESETTRNNKKVNLSCSYALCFESEKQRWTELEPAGRNGKEKGLIQAH